MNLYDYILRVSNYIKEEREIQELIESFKEIEMLKNDIKYNIFFSIIESKECYGFFAPNISMQIISNVYKNNDFKIIPKDACELILNNESIKKYVKISTKVNEIITNKITSLFNTQEFKGVAKETYSYNALSEKLGNIGFLANLKIMTGKGEEIQTYFKERNKIIEEGAKVLPINKIDNNFLETIYKLNISKEAIESIERFNLLLYLIERIIYCNVYEEILYIQNDKLKVLEEIEKSNIIYKEMIIDDNRLYIKNFPILIINNQYYFPYSKQIKLGKETTIKCKCFSCNLDKKDALLNISIINTLDLFKKE